jgi:hypothetical protein
VRPIVSRKTSLWKFGSAKNNFSKYKSIYCTLVFNLWPHLPPSPPPIAQPYMEATADNCASTSATFVGLDIQSLQENMVSNRNLRQLVEQHLRPGARSLVQVTKRATTPAQAIARQKELQRQATSARYVFQILKMPVNDSKRHIEVSSRIQSGLNFDYGSFSSSETKSIVSLSQEIFQSLAHQVSKIDIMYNNLESQLCVSLNRERFLIFRRDCGVREFMLSIADTRFVIPSPPTSPSDSTSSTSSTSMAHDGTCCVCTENKSDRDLSEMPCCRRDNSKIVCYECIERHFFEKSHYGVDQLVGCMFCSVKHDVYLPLTINASAIVTRSAAVKRKREE